MATVPPMLLHGINKPGQVSVSAQGSTSTRTVIVSGGFKIISGSLLQATSKKIPKKKAMTLRMVNFF